MSVWLLSGYVASPEIEPTVAEQQQIVAAMKDAIATNSVPNSEPVQVTKEADPDLQKAADSILCPLGFEIPPAVSFPGRSLFEQCQDLDGLRNHVQAQFDIPSGSGQFWLPIVHTARGSLYGELIGWREQATLQGDSPSTKAETRFLQPVHMGDRWRQPLYKLAQQLLHSLQATPAVYLMQIGFQNGALCFDRLFPFPATPAIASLGIQTPDLYHCHWLCLTEQPIKDVSITPPVTYWVYDPQA